MPGAPYRRGLRARGPARHTAAGASAPSIGGRVQGGAVVYSEADLQSAVEAGAITRDAADALRAHVAALQAMPSVDEEQFRLITGFNDVFVSIACALVIFAAAACGAVVSAPVAGLSVAAAAWLMAEMFTRRRRMGLPSIILLLAFVIGAGVCAATVLDKLFPEHPVPQSGVWDGETHTWTVNRRHPWEDALLFAGAAVAAGLAALAHWRRFRVAITIAAAVAALVLLVLSGLAAATGETSRDSTLLAPAALACGLGCFAYAMHWDMSDPARRTQRADVAFWLHLLAAPLIAHPLFLWMGVTGGAAVGLSTASGVLAIYILFAVIALAIDRRALLVSALAYVLGALASLFRTYGSVQLNTALTALVIGSALLMLSAWWTPIRGWVLARLPAPLGEHLPAAGRGAAGSA